MGRFIAMAALACAGLTTQAAHAAAEPAGFWLSVSAEYKTGTYLREWSGFLALNVPLEHLAAPRVMYDAAGLTEEPTKKQTAPAPAPLAPAPPPAPAPEAAPKPAPFLLTHRLARSAVKRALAVAGYFDMRSRLGSLASRARSSAALPELGLRTQRSSGQTLRLTPTTDDPYRYTQAGTSELSLEARLTWHFDRLLFANEEVTIERLQHQRDAAERRLIDYVLQRLVLWQRARVRAADPDLDPEVRETAELEALGAAVELDVLTDGWFSQAIGESEGGAEGQAGESAQVEVKTARHAR